jgi:hypothetical protein
LHLCPISFPNGGAPLSATFAMTTKAVLPACLLLLFATGCSPSHPPAQFAHQISLADRIVVTNQYRPVSMTVTGQDLLDVSTAVTNAIEDKNPYAAVWDWDIQFYAGTNFLTAIHLQDRTFLACSNQYSDSSGVLKRFWQTLEERAEVK